MIGPRIIRTALAGWLLAALLLALPASYGQEIDVETATKVKAAYLLQFPKFVKWPERSFATRESPIVIGVLGDDPFGPVLDATVDGERAQGRTIEVRRFGEQAPLPQDCHVVFVSASNEHRLDQVLDAYSGTSVLTISDIEQFAERGGVIGLTPEQGRIVFKVNRSAAENGQLKLSARLLRLARIVDPLEAQRAELAGH